MRGSARTSTRRQFRTGSSSGKFVGLALVLGAFMLSLTAAGMLTQTLMGYHDFQVGLYLKILFGLQLPEYLLFAVLVLLVHALVDQKHVAMLVALVVYFLIVFSSVLGVEHKLLVYGSSPGWSFTDMRGFGSSVGPWLVFKVYWAAWRCCWRWWRRCSGCAAGRSLSEADRHGAVASPAGRLPPRPWRWRSSSRSAASSSTTPT